MTQDVHISSLVVVAMPDRQQEVCDSVESIPIAEVSRSEANGRIVVLLESAAESEIVDALTQIQLFEGVLSASLVYHQVASASDLEEIVYQG